MDFDHRILQSINERKAKSVTRGYANQSGRLQNFQDNLILEKILKEQNKAKETEDLLKGYSQAQQDLEKAEEEKARRELEAKKKRDKCKEELITNMEIKKFDELQKLQLEKMNNSINLRGGAASALNDQFEQRRNTIIQARTRGLTTPELSIDLIGTNPFYKYSRQHVAEHKQRQIGNNQINSSNERAYDGRSLITHS